MNNCYQSSRETPRIGLRRAFMAQEGTIRSEWVREVCLIQVLKRDSSVIGVEIGLVPLKVGGSLLTQSQIDWALLYLISFGFLLACYLRRWDGRLVPVWLSASRRGLLIKSCCYQPKMYLSNVGREKNCNKRGKKPSRPTGPVCLLHEPRNSPHARYTASLDTCSGHANHRSAAAGTTGTSFCQPSPGGKSTKSRTSPVWKQMRWPTRRPPSI